MKIAIFHNLKEGGGFIYLTSIVNELFKMGFEVHIYTHQRLYIPKVSETFLIEIPKSRNILTSLKRTLVDMDAIQKSMSEEIKKRKYKYCFVFPCHAQQSPPIIKYLPKKKTYYFYLESLREFYENTTFDYYSCKRIISRLLRLPLMLTDYINCSSAQNIIADSYYSSYQLNKLYKKRSDVVYPGVEFLPPKTKIVKNNKKALSFGLLSKLKGHHISSQIYPSVEIFGSTSHENIFEHINSRTKVFASRIKHKTKILIYKKYAIYLANQINEPFGISTLEAATYNCYIVGRNEAGTSEIVNNGCNGFLYDINNIKSAQKYLTALNNKTKIRLYKTIGVSWKNTINKIFNIINYV